MRNSINRLFVGLFLNRMSVFFTTLLMGVFFFVIGCNKEKVPEVTASEVGTGTNFMKPSCLDFCDDCGDGQCNPRNVLEAIATPDDASNNQVNMILYHYAYAVKEAAKNPTLRQYMLNAMSVNDQSLTPSLLVLAQQNSAFASVINNKLKESMASHDVYPRGVEPGIDILIATAGWDANAYLKAKILHRGISYSPVIHYITKPVPASNALPATVLIGQEVNDCDDVAGWKGDTEVLMGEAEASGASKAVFIVGPGESNAAMEAKTPDTEVQDRTSTINMSSIKIKGLAFRYENSGKSEIKGGYVAFTPGPTYTEHTNNNQIFFTKIKKCEIKDQKTVSVTNLMVTDGFWDTRSHFFCFSEYDWYGSFWTREAPCNTAAKFKSQSKFQDEWYTLEFCGIGTSYFPLSGGTLAKDNNKSTFTITGI